MNDIITSQKDKLVKRLSNCDLVELEFNAFSMSLRLVFSFAGYEGGEGHEISLLLYKVYSFSLTRTLDEYEAFFVGNVVVNNLEQSNDPQYQQNQLGTRCQ